MDINEFKRDRIKFLVQLCQSCSYDTKRGANAFEIGRELQFDDEKTNRIVNYLLEKKFIRKSQFDIPINTGDPPSQENFLLIFITPEGIDQLTKEEHSETVSSVYHDYGDTYQTDIRHVDKSNIQIGDQGYIHSVNITEAESKQLANILTQLKNMIHDLQPEQKNEIQYDVLKLENELYSHTSDKNKIVKTVSTLYNKIKDITPLIGIAIQLGSLFKPT
jgi:coenzyme F420-reducing hydrogenase delta subunit